MNWSKIKNIMIIILAVINIFLLLNIGLNRYVSKALPKGTSESFQNILADNGITMEEGAVPHYYETRALMKATSHDIDYLTKIFIGEKVKYVNEGKGIVASAADKKLFFSEDRIEYTTLKTSVEKDGRRILKALESIGLSKNGAYFEETTGYVKVRVDGVEIEGAYLDVFLDEKGEISYLSGVWPKIIVEGTDDKVSVIQVTNKICDILPRGSHINNIEKTYILEYGIGGYSIKNGWVVYNQGRGYTIK